MKDLKYKKILFTGWLLIAILSLLWIFYSVIKDTGLIFSISTYLFVFILVCLTLVIALLSISNKVTAEKITIKKEEEHEENVRDYYLYQQLLDPPDMNN